MQQLLKQLEKAWKALSDSYAGLSPSEMLQPGVTGDWTVKDILAHVTTWEEEALKHIPVILNGERPQRYSVKYGGINAFNAQMTETKRKLQLSAVLQQFDQTHRRLVEYIKSIPEDQISAETRARRRLRLDTYSHYPKHARAIRRWRDTALAPLDR